jgi:hypothetical protein
MILEMATRFKKNSIDSLLMHRIQQHDYEEAIHYWPATAAERGALKPWGQGLRSRGTERLNLALTPSFSAISSAL